MNVRGLCATLLLLGCGCGQADGVKYVREVRVQWEGREADGWKTVQAPAYENRPKDAHVAVLEWTVPPNTQPGMNLGFVPRREFKAQLDDQPPVALTPTWILIPLPTDGQPHRFRVWATAHIFVGVDPLGYGPGASVLFLEFREVGPRMVIASAMLVLALLLVLLSVRGRAAVPMRAIAGLAFCLAVLDFAENDVVGVLTGIPVYTWFGLHELAMLFPIVAVMVFVRSTLGDTQHRLLLWVMRTALVLATAELVMWLGNTMLAASLRPVSMVLTLTGLVLAGWVAWRETRAGSKLARPVLWGLLVLFALVIPGLLEGVNLLPGAGFNFSRWGVLGFLYSLGYALLLADRDRTVALGARVDELERTRAEIETLNAELRRQVADKSRALAASMESAEPSVSRPPSVGEVFDDRYVVIRVIGRGAMGAVYEVRRISDKKPFALKLMLGSLGRQHGPRFMQEAHIAARIQHPNLVGVVDVGLTQTGTPFLVMELVPGWSLDRLEDRFKERPWALEVLVQIARGMRALHKDGVVHRDLKPANVVVGEGPAKEPVVKLTDFGIAHQASSSRSSSDTIPMNATDEGKLTRVGDTMGTPQYLAPDLVGAAHTTTVEADAFSFGVMACEILCSTYPFTIPPALEVMAGRKPQEADTAFLARSGLPKTLTALLTRCLSLVPGDRPSAGDLLAALEEALAVAVSVQPTVEILARP